MILADDRGINATLKIALGIRPWLVNTTEQNWCAMAIGVKAGGIVATGCNKHSNRIQACWPALELWYFVIQIRVE